MGWEVQGYYKNPGEEAPSWHVECSGDSLQEVEAFWGRNPLSKEQADSLEIYYGNRNLELFRGISFSTNQHKLKEQLLLFEGFLVYAEKWNPHKKAFRNKQIVYLPVGALTIFHENLKEDPDLLKRGLRDLLDRLTSSDQIDQLALKTFQSHIQSISVDEKG